MIEREKLSGNNFIDMFRQLKLVLRVKKKMYVIEQPLPAAPAVDSTTNVLAEWNAIYDAYNEFACLILGCMSLELHRQFKNSSPYDMIKELKSMFEKQSRVESLTKDFAEFVRNYNMHNMGKTIGELHAMLIEYEKGLPKKAETPQDKQVYIPKPKNPKPAAKEHPAKDDTCHRCKEVGHLKRNCLVYLVELLKKKKQVGSGFREARKLEQEALYLYVGNGVHTQVEAIESFDLVFPNGLVICLDNCHYAPSITRGKMRRKSFPHRLERATDLFGIIHTDVCGPLRDVSRQSTSYFITFTDDYSRYGYVYLLKHKHEVFETFKVFKNEVENQLGKKIKAL
nr:hypothetical protein [Tanacetum cinerariifolium]